MILTRHEQGRLASVFYEKKPVIGAAVRGESYRTAQGIQLQNSAEPNL
jgi:hypothetical protein